MAVPPAPIDLPPSAGDLSRRVLLRAAAIAGAAGLVQPNGAPDRALTPAGSWFDLAVFIATKLGSEGRATWFNADWSQVIQRRMQSGELPAGYQPHPSAWYAAVHDRSWIGDKLIAVNADTKRYVVADVIDVMSNPNAIVDLSVAAFEELGVARSAGVQRLWTFRLPG